MFSSSALWKVARIIQTERGVTLMEFWIHSISSKFSSRRDQKCRNTMGISFTAMKQVRLTILTAYYSNTRTSEPCFEEVKNLINLSKIQPTLVLRLHTTAWKRKIIMLFRVLLPFSQQFTSLSEMLLELLLNIRVKAVAEPLVTSHQKSFGFDQQFTKLIT